MAINSHFPPLRRKVQNMWYKKCLGPIFFLLLALIPSAVLAQDTPEPNFLVHFAPHVTYEERQGWMDRHCATELDWMWQIYVAEVRFSSDCRNAVLPSLADQGVVTLIERDVIVYGSSTITDPLILDRDKGQPWRLVDSFGAWKITRGRGDVVIAFVDSGIDLNHPEFAGRILPGYDFVNDDNDPQDDNGHGTNTAGIIAAAADGVGIVGMCPECKLLPVKVLKADNSGTWESIAKGILFATDQGVPIINLSLGATMSSTTIISAVQYALDNGVMVVAAAGNNAWDKPFYPAAIPGVIGVSGTDLKDQFWPVSNYGGYVDIAAPAIVDSTHLGGGYNFGAGTSLSAPFVAGVAGLIWSLRPELSSPEVERLLESTATEKGDPGWDPYFGYGRLDAHAALVAANGGFDPAYDLHLPYISGGN